MNQSLLSEVPSQLNKISVDYIKEKSSCRYLGRTARPYRDNSREVKNGTLTPLKKGINL